MAVKAIPERYHSVQPYLVVEGAQKLIAFLSATLGATEEERLPGPDGKVGHAEMRIGDSVVMLADAGTGDESTPTTAMLVVYVDDADKTYRKALEGGATSIREPADQFYGDRSAAVRDPFGNQWWFHTHIEDVSSEEMQRRAQELAQNQG